MTRCEERSIGLPLASWKACVPPHCLYLRTYQSGYDDSQGQPAPHVVTTPQPVVRKTTAPAATSVSHRRRKNPLLG